MEGFQVCSAKAVNSKESQGSYYKDSVSETLRLFLPLLLFLLMVFLAREERAMSVHTDYFTALGGNLRV